MFILRDLCCLSYRFHRCRPIRVLHRARSPLIAYYGVFIQSMPGKCQNRQRQELETASKLFESLCRRFTASNPNTPPIHTPTRIVSHRHLIISLSYPVHFVFVVLHIAHGLHSKTAARSIRAPLVVIRHLCICTGSRVPLHHESPTPWAPLFTGNSSPTISLQASNLPAPLPSPLNPIQ